MKVQLTSFGAATGNPSSESLLRQMRIYAKAPFHRTIAKPPFNLNSDDAIPDKDTMTYYHSYGLVCALVENLFVYSSPTITQEILIQPWTLNP